MKAEIKRLLKKGDIVYSAKDGSEMIVTEVFSRGFKANNEYFYFHEVRERYFLTEKGYKIAKRSDDNAENI